VSAGTSPDPFLQVDDDGLVWRVVPAGAGAAMLVADADPAPELSRRLAARRAALWATRPRSVHDLVPAYTGLLAEYRAGADPGRVHAWLASDAPGVPAVAPKRFEFDVAYGEAADVDALEQALGTPWPALVEAHAAATYTVAFIGFTPGFPYLLGLPPSLSLPRRATPAARVPAGAVAIADSGAGIYPSASPGGWWVLGRTSARLFDPYRFPPALLATGDEVRFIPRPAGSGGGGVTVADPGASGRDGDEGDPEPRRHAPPALLEPALEVLEAWQGAVTIQARPRWGVGHHGLAQAGPIDPGAATAALEIVGAPHRSGLLEVTVPVLTLLARRSVTATVTGGAVRVTVDGRETPTWRPFTLAPGATVELTPRPGEGGSVAYLAVGGGLRAIAPPTAHPSLLESDSTDVRAGIGGFGRALEAGDQLAHGAHARAPRPWAGRPRYGARALLRLHPGPQPDARALESLTSSVFVVDRRDRTGVRLEGPAIELERHDVRSQGVPWGAVQVPADGRPIVLLADRGRTGGYAVPAVVDPRDLWQLGQARPGTEVWFLPPGTGA
jgi:KipI family sensor histidine kinase inhibitor